MNNENILNEIARNKELMNFNYAINEQRRPIFKIKKGKKITLSKGEPGKTDYVDFKNYKVTTPETEWDSFLSQDSQMISLMDENSKSMWSKLKSDLKNKAYAVASLEEFNETYPKYKWEKVVVGGKHLIDKQTVKKEPQKFPVIPMKFPADLSPSSKFFKDNYYEVTDLFKQSVKTDIIDPILNQLSNITTPNDVPKAYLESISVLTSCSRIPNTTSPDGKKYSFQELSQLRNETAKKYIMDELTKVGVVINNETKVTQNSEGQNKDGTSGPDWTGKNQDRPKYEKYKYLDVDLEIIFNTQEKQIENPEDDIVTIESDIYDITFVKPGKKGLSFRLPKIVIEFVKGKRRRSRKKIRVADCPIFKAKSYNF